MPETQELKESEVESGPTLGGRMPGWIERGRAVTSAGLQPSYG
jgi:hypothetical protein